MRIKQGIFLLIIGLFAACNQAPKQNVQQSADPIALPPQKLRLPEIPTMLILPEDRARYLTNHYWENFNFSDTTLCSLPDITEQAFVDFVQVLDEVTLQDAQAGIDSLLNKAMAGDSVMYACFTGLSEKYLYDPNSPMRNEDYYTEVLRHIIASPRISEEEKVRPRFRLELAGKNRVGSVATDFSYTQADGKKARLSSLRSEYILLFFNNPDCEDCRRVKEFIQQSPVFSGNSKLKVVSIYPDEDIDLWKRTTYPSQWVSGYNSALHSGTVYDLLAIPNLYLLDKDRRVLIKDGTIEAIERYLAARL